MTDKSNANGSHFPDTRWSLVLRASRVAEPGHKAALEHLYLAYWYPLYLFARKIGRQPEDAEDAVQDFFVALNGKNLWADADSTKGKLRTFLLVVFKRHLGTADRRTRAQKRGGGVEHVAIDWASGEERYAEEPMDARTPESNYHRRWSLLLAESTLDQLALEREAAGKGREFAVYRQFLTIHLPKVDSYLDAARAVGTSEGKVAVAVHRLRLRFRHLLRRRIADTLHEPTEEEIDGEWQALVTILGDPAAGDDR